MFPAGHFGIVMIAYAPIAYVLIVRNRERVVTPGLASALLVTFLPDLDALVPGLVHRGLSHTVLAVLVLGTLSALVWWTVGPRSLGDRVRRGAFGFLVGALGAGCHLAGDVVTPMGVQPSLPLDSTVYTATLVAAERFEANLALLVVGIAVHTATVHLARLSVSPGDDSTAEGSVEAPVNSDSGARR
jgi:inner membrane protein